MRLAIQEDMLPGKTVLEQLQNAAALGLAGVEFWAENLTQRVPEIDAALRETGLMAAGVNYGRGGRLLDPDRPQREAALAAFRRAVVDAVDIGAPAVILVPHFGQPALPYLTPYKSLIQLEYELLHNHLRTLSDYVYAIGVDLYIQPVNRYETHFINTLADGVRVRRRIKDHPHVKLAADTFHMALEETDPTAALRDYAADIGYIHLADSNRRLPGQGRTDFAAVISTLKQANYAGWLTLSGGSPGHNAEDARRFMDEVPLCLAFLRKMGL